MEVIRDSLASMLEAYDDGVWGGRIHSRTRSGTDTGLISSSSPSKLKQDARPIQANQNSVMEAGQDQTWEV